MLSRGAIVSMDGTTVRTSSGIGLVPTEHLEEGFPAQELVLPDSTPALVHVVGANGLRPGQLAVIQGRWDDGLIEAFASNPMQGRQTDDQGLRRKDVRPQTRNLALRPNEEVRAELVRLESEGIIFGWLPLHDGSIRVVADKAWPAADYLRRISGLNYSIVRPRFTSEQRKTVRRVEDEASNQNLLCGIGVRADADVPAELLPFIEVPWVSQRLADVLAAVPPGLLSVRTHVKLTTTSQ